MTAAAAPLVSYWICAIIAFVLWLRYEKERRRMKRELVDIKLARSARHLHLARGLALNAKELAVEAGVPRVATLVEEADKRLCEALHLANAACLDDETNRPTIPGAKGR